MYRILNSVTQAQPYIGTNQINSNSKANAAYVFSSVIKTEIACFGKKKKTGTATYKFPISIHIVLICISHFNSDLDLLQHRKEQVRTAENQGSLQVCSLTTMTRFAHTVGLFCRPTSNSEKHTSQSLLCMVSSNGDSQGALSHQSIPVLTCSWLQGWGGGRGTNQCIMNHFSRSLAPECYPGRITTDPPQVCKLQC